MCGVEGLLLLKEKNFITLKYVVGLGTNNRVEIFSLWLVMKCVVDRGIEKV